MSLMNLARIVEVFVLLQSLQSLMFDVTLQSTKSRESCDSTIERIIFHLLSVSTPATAIPFLLEHRLSRSSAKEDLAVR